MQVNNIFSGLKVLDLASVFAVSSVGQFFAELGAEVIKIENPKTNGDITRHWKLPEESKEADISAYFSSVNWGKQSVALDISQEEGLNILYGLVKQCDMLVASYKPGDADKLKVDYQSLLKVNPTLIYGHITGYGLGNSKVGYDAVVQAESGFMYLNGERGGKHLKMPVALMDILAGHQLKEGMLLAYINKLKSGQGSYVSVSLIQAAVASLANQAANYLVAKKNPEKMGSAHPNIAPYGSLFSTKDDKQLILAVGSDSQFKKLCEILKIEEIGEDIRFATNANRVKNRKQLGSILSEEIAGFEIADLLYQLNKNKVPAGSVHSVKEALALPESKAIFLESSNKNLRGLKTMICQFGVENEKSSHCLPPPRFGEHTQSILSDNLAISRTQIALLLDKKVIQ